jgi:hypothetical protein
MALKSDFEKFLENDMLICPITMEPIKVAACTILGYIYEKDAIIEWLKQSDRDPATNQKMKDLHITTLRSFSPLYEYNLNDLKREVMSCNMSAKRIATRYVELLGNPVSISNFRETKMVYKKLREYKDVVDGLYEEAEWETYKEFRRNMYINNYVCPYIDGAYMGESYLEKIVKMDTVVRPANTGFGYQFISLDGLKVKGVEHKLERFDFSDLSNSVFIECGFSRCTFIGANLSGTVFINCSFIGEQVSFYKSIGIPTFSNCCIEPVGSWNGVYSDDSPDEFIKCLQNRGLDTANLNYDSDL